MKTRGSKAFLVLGVVLAAPSAASAAPYGGTLSIAVSGFGSVSFIGAGSGSSAPSGVAVPGGAFAGSGSVPVTGDPPLTAVAAKITGNGAASFAGDPLAGSMPIFGVAALKVDVGLGPATLVEIPLFTSHEPSSAAGEAGVGVGGSQWWVPAPGFYVSVVHQDWSEGAETVTGLAYDYVYHIPAGKAASMAITYSYLNATLMVTGTDSRTPGGLGQVTLVSPTRVALNLSSGIARLVVIGSLTLRFVPEPGTLLLLGSGTAALGWLGRRRLPQRGSRVSARPCSAASGMRAMRTSLRRSMPSSHG